MNGARPKGCMVLGGGAMAAAVRALLCVLSIVPVDGTQIGAMYHG